MTTDSSERRTAWIIGAITIAEGSWCVFNFLPNPSRFLHYLGFSSGVAGKPLGWVLAAGVAILYVLQALHLPSVRANLLRPSRLKLLALAMAVAAGILEEVFFRKLLMDYLARHDVSAVSQVIASGIAFGVLHGIWGLFGGRLRTAIGATIYTTIMGAALALVYLLSGRSLAPCVVAHFAITFFIEPGLVLAAVRGEMSR